MLLESRYLLLRILHCIRFFKVFRDVLIQCPFSGHQKRTLNVRFPDNHCTFFIHMDFVHTDIGAAGEFFWSQALHNCLSSFSNLGLRQMMTLNPENVSSNPSRNRYIKKRTYNVRFSKNVHSMSVFQNVHPMSCFISNPQMSVSGQIMYVKKNVCREVF